MVVMIFAVPEHSIGRVFGKVVRIRGPNLLAHSAFFLCYMRLEVYFGHRLTKGEVMANQAVIYYRVSTTDQDVDGQRRRKKRA